MAVIKSYNPTTGCHDSGRYNPDWDWRSAVNVAKAYRERSAILGELYVGEAGVLDLDLSKIECDICRFKLTSELEIGIQRRF